MTISFTVPGLPVSYKRNDHNFGQRKSFLPKRYRDYRNAVALIAKSLMRGREYTTKPVSVIIKIYHKVKADSHNSGDIDNHLKSILDSLNKIVFKDDGQVVQATVFKFKDETNPRVEVYITDEF